MIPVNQPISLGGKLSGLSEFLKLVRSSSPLTVSKMAKTMETEVLEIPTFPRTKIWTPQELHVR
jgi:hypothetical protein